jgi:thiamine kinase-like enzyme
MMEKDLKEYLDRLSGKVDVLSGNVDKLTSDVAGIKETMATKKDLEKVERRLSKRIKENLDYIKLVDEDVSAHRRNTEVHVAPLKKA